MTAEDLSSRARPHDHEPGARNLPRRLPIPTEFLSSSIGEIDNLESFPVKGRKARRDGPLEGLMPPMEIGSASSLRRRTVPRYTKRWYGWVGDRDPCLASDRRCVIADLTHPTELRNCFSLFRPVNAYGAFVIKTK